MLGISKLQLGLLIGAGLLIASLSLYAKHTTEKLGEAKADNQTLKSGLETQSKTIAQLQLGIERADKALATLEQENAALSQRKQRTKTVFREVLVNDPKAAECGNAAMPESVSSLVLEYARNSDGNRGDTPAVITDSDRTGT